MKKKILDKEWGRGGEYWKENEKEKRVCRKRKGEGEGEGREKEIGMSILLPLSTSSPWRSCPRGARRSGFRAPTAPRRCTVLYGIKKQKILY